MFKNKFPKEARKNYLIDQMNKLQDQMNKLQDQMNKLQEEYNRLDKEEELGQEEIEEGVEDINMISPRKNEKEDVNIEEEKSVDRIEQLEEVQKKNFISRKRRRIKKVCQGVARKTAPITGGANINNIIYLLDPKTKRKFKGRRFYVTVNNSGRQVKYALRLRTEIGKQRFIGYFKTRQEARSVGIAFSFCGEYNGWKMANYFKLKSFFNLRKKVK